MKRRLPGLSETASEPRAAIADGVFLVRIASAQYRWHAQKPFYGLRLSILEPEEYKEHEIASRLYCTPKAMWKLGWFLRDFIGHECPDLTKGQGVVMNYSYTQISQYLTCPRRYRHRYLDGWQEKDVRAAVLFGRAFEQAVAALFRREDPAAVLFEQWVACKHPNVIYSGNDTWDSMLKQGIQLLERFVQDGRVHIRRPRSRQQVQFTRTLSSGNSFVAFVDAIGELDGTACLLEWKTSSARYPEQPAGLTGLDPQLICYSWMTGIDRVTQVVFVRKRVVEVQYLSATLTDEQRQEFETLVEDTVRRIESGSFLPHSGIRFPQNPCTTCPFLGICLNRPDLVEMALVRQPGVDLGVCLTNLLTREPPLPPKLNHRRARLILGRIDDILAWEAQHAKDRDTKFVQLGKYLCEVRAGQYWRIENLKSFDEFLERRFPESRRKAYYLMSIHEHLPPQVKKDLLEVGWTKGLELAKLARKQGQRFESATWMHKAKEMPKDEFKREVEKELTGKDSEPSELIYFKVYKSQIPVIEQAIEIAALMLGSDKSRGYCLEMICADFLAGAHIDGSDPETLLRSISRYFTFLPRLQQEAFVASVNTRVS